ncbi:MAG TPA: GNAT family N-acetyltransferase [Chloroflexia bacterium]|nr:GNAT family N-acetyltransferase [Chloroflexia bacterium]
MFAPARRLTPADSPALDALLATTPLPGVYARSHLRAHGLGAGGVQAYGCPADTGPGRGVQAAVVAYEGIAWAVWESADQAAALAQSLAGLGVDLLSGPRALVEPFRAQLPPAAVGEGEYCPFQVLRPADLQAPGAGPPARRATLADMEPLIDFYSRGFYSLAQLPTRDAWRARLTEQLAHRTLFLVEQDRMVVAAALSSAETPDAAMIGGVATVTAYRNRGLSGRCVHALCTALFAAGIGQIGLFYLPTNIAAARVYDKLGFHLAGEWWLQRLGPF